MHFATGYYSRYKCGKVRPESITWSKALSRYSLAIKNEGKLHINEFESSIYAHYVFPPRSLHPFSVP